jgi:putative PIN family toxin of toxin-antitoxin system
LIRAVIDTNLIISALLKPTGTVGAVLGRLREGEYEIVLSEPLLAELVDVLNRPRIKDKYGIDPEDIEIVLALLLLRGISVEPVERIDVCRIPKDNVILEAAVATEMDVVVTGDEVLPVLNPFRSIPIVRPADFLTMLDHNQ